MRYIGQLFYNDGGNAQVWECERCFRMTTVPDNACPECELKGLATRATARLREVNKLAVQSIS